MNNQENGYYTLGSLWCVAINRDLKPNEYMRMAFSIGVKSISLLELNEVKDYFTRAKLESKMIDKQMRTQTLLNKNELMMKAAHA